jgi:quercetin dioxygenase-like cupin family protein
MEMSLEGWDITHSDDVDWAPWGADDKARAKVLANADGYAVVLVEAQPGYRGGPHRHDHGEFLFVLDGTVRNQGQDLKAGGAYAAAAGSTHDEFGTESGATYLSIFKL